MKKKNKKMAAISIASILTVTGLGSLLLDNKLVKNPPKEETSLKSNQTLAMYVEGNDGYELTTSKTFPTKGYVLNTEKSSCKNGGTISQDPKTKVLSVSVSHADQCSVYFDKASPYSEIIASSNGVKTNFDDPALIDEGIFEMEDDYGISYYYRGDVTNNYVKFGKWNENTPTVYRGQYSETSMYSREYSTLEECQKASSYNVNCTKIDRAGKDMYWRIIRVNGDGSLRIVYTGTQAYANGMNNSEMFIKTDQIWGNANGDTKFVGWMYGGVKTEASTSKEQAQTNETDSDIKTLVDNWYKENILDTGYSGDVADILFCNDRSIPGSEITGLPNISGLGYGKNSTFYGAWARFYVGNGENSWSTRKNITPTFKCPEKNDSFTVNDTIKGNGDLTYPVGLITADEIVAAGSGTASTSNTESGTSNKKYYLYRPSTPYWLFSPCYYMGFEYAKVFYVSAAGDLNRTSVGSYNSSTIGVAPVINLSIEYAKSMIGDGTRENPYRKNSDLINPDDQVS